ncbi:hypothetical protein [Chitinophaga sp.]|uniref:hypothetical protein n=1 Tax=Chitinophaga sp. TaxID=1869181 RepID=UPI002F92E631
MTTRSTAVAGAVTAKQGSSYKWWQIAGISLIVVLVLVAVYHYQVPDAVQVNVYQFIESLFRTELLFYIVAGYRYHATSPHLTAIHPLRNYVYCSTLYQQFA